MQPVPAAPWRKQFLEHMSKMKSPEFVLSTLDTTDPDFGTAPRARFCIYRGLWADLEHHDKNPADRNPAAYQSDCITFTTDVRMEKAGQLFRSATGAGAVAAEEVRTSGGGGPVEAVWWVNTEDGLKTQWRVRGDAFVLAPGCEGEDDRDHLAAKTALTQWMRVVDESKVFEWSWEREITGHFGNCTPLMRGSFKHPPPGVNLRDTPDIRPDLKLGEAVEDVHDEVARENFRVVVIRPFHVESTDLSDPPHSRRQQYAYNKDERAWKHETTWP